MASHRNILLASLKIKDFRLLEPHLQAVTLGLRKNLEKPNQRIEAVYFPESGFASVVAIQSPKTEVEVGLIGHEGMTGVAVVLGNHRSPHATYMQAAGTGHCIPADDLRKAIRASLSLRDLLTKYAIAFGVQTAHTAICNANSRLDQRLARWLLMAHDRIGADVVPLTHEFLALMLAARRAGVTEALGALKKEGLVVYSRGNITVRDRKGMERRAGKSYGVPESEYRRLIG